MRQDSKKTAARDGIHEIESVAAEIKEVSVEDLDLVPLLVMVEQLLSLCRSAQKVHVHTSYKIESRQEVEHI